MGLHQHLEGQPIKRQDTVSQRGLLALANVMPDTTQPHIVKINICCELIRSTERLPPCATAADMLFMTGQLWCNKLHTERQPMQITASAVIAAAALCLPAHSLPLLASHPQLLL